MDYKELLKKYMEHIIDCESIDFIDTWGPTFKFTSQEIEELRKISNEITKEH